MPLDDRFNRSDGGLIDEVDGFLFNCNKRIAEYWQNKTYRSKKDLVTILYPVGSLSLGAFSVNARNYAILIPAAIFGLSTIIKDRRLKSGLEEEMLMESIGLPRKLGKVNRILAYGLGISLISVGVGYIVAGIITNDKKFYTDSATPLFFGIGTISFVSADYISESDIGNPPKKPKKKPLLERIKEKMSELLPRPLPEPLPGTYSTIDNYVLFPQPTNF